MFKRTIVCALFLTFGWASSIAAQPAPKPSDVPMPPLTEPSDPKDTAVAFLELPPKPSAISGFGSVVDLSDHPAPIPTPGLMSTIVNWLSTEFALPATYEHPRIRIDHIAGDGRKAVSRLGARPEPSVEFRCHARPRRSL